MEPSRLKPLLAVFACAVGAASAAMLAVPPAAPDRIRVTHRLRRPRIPIQLRAPR